MRNFSVQVLERTLRRFRLAVVGFNKSGFNNSPKDLFELIMQVRKSGELTMHDIEAYQLCKYYLSTNNLEGDIIEVGAYKGGSSQLLAALKPKTKKLFVCDTFEGLKDVSKEDGGDFHNAQFSSVYEDVKLRLKKYKNVNIIRGYFPESFGGLKKVRFCFANIDTDTYVSVKTVLKALLPRMQKGGVIIVHDHNVFNGVRKAVSEVMKGRKEVLVELPGSQCVIFCF